MESLFIELIKQVNPVQTIMIGLIFFYFYSRLDNKITKLDEKFTSRFDKLDEKFTFKFDKLNDKYDKLNELIIDLYRTLFKRDAA